MENLILAYENFFFFTWRSWNWQSVSLKGLILFQFGFRLLENWYCVILVAKYFKVYHYLSRVCKQLRWKMDGRFLVLYPFNHLNDFLVCAKSIVLLLAWYKMCVKFSGNIQLKPETLWTHGLNISRRTKVLSEACWKWQAQPWGLKMTNGVHGWQYSNSKNTRELSDIPGLCCA